MINEQMLSNDTDVEPSKWIELYADYLFKYAVIRVHKKELAEDLVQDTFVSAIRSIKSFQHKSTERTWLTSILKNKILDHYKKRSTQRELNISENELEPSGHFKTEGIQKGRWNKDVRPENWDTDHETPVEKMEFYTTLTNCIGGLPDQWATVFSLKNLEDLSAGEICKEVGISSSNYWVIMHRAKLMLRECMGKNWFS